MRDEEKAAASAAHTPDSKWAALLNDKLVPLPRQRLKARDILAQSGEASGTQLLRDFNSPNDAAFAPDAEVDLADGNVFRTARDCTTADSDHSGQPKLAFVLDDRWEVTIVPRQTGDTLRGLFGLADDVELLRDYESPRDEPIDEREKIHFSDGPVFVTKAAGPHNITIIVNGRRKKVSKRRLSFMEVVALAYDPVRTEPLVLYTVSYSRGPRVNPEGELLAGQSVKLKEGMVFCVTETDKS